MRVNSLPNPILLNHREYKTLIIEYLSEENIFYSMNMKTPNVKFTMHSCYTQYPYYKIFKQQTLDSLFVRAVCEFENTIHRIV